MNAAKVPNVVPSEKPSNAAGIAALQLAEDLPEEAAVHPPGDPAAFAGVERVGLGVLDVVGEFVEEGVEKFLQVAAAVLSVV